MNKAVFKAYNPADFDYTGHCLPAGLTRLVNTPMPMKAYNRPFSNKRTFKLRRDWELMEYSCEENNKEVTEGHIK